MTKAIFQFVPPDDILRKMNKQQYKATMSWLRLVRRKIQKKIEKTLVTQDKIASDEARRMFMFIERM